MKKLLLHACLRSLGPAGIAALTPASAFSPKAAAISQPTAERPADEA